ncbi:hypothetical protein F5876DRAFT_41144 [Lentinula aff. lateritia]|uniref:Uncharacterized protein n=1 Tax=Lentinula aff. lateritia TaxID=2804960 RepID=A0ACC1U1E9_9AGAR|nr:hypothetical protein F5876DRAFT_41144 [Lentinula aff. lateritia]
MAYNYAKALGWNSVAAAAVFAALYSPLALYFVVKIIQERRKVLFTMTLFCTIRVAAFIMRAISAGVTSAGDNDGLFIATEVLFSVGFFGLLYATYTLVMDRLDLCDNDDKASVPTPIIGNLLRLTRNRRLFRMALIVPMALGIAGINLASSDPTSSIGTSLREASAIIFLVLTVIQVLQTLVLIKAEHEGKDSLTYTFTSFGTTHASLLFGIISLLLLIREIFTVVTINNIAQANNEHLWYPLIALPEILCVLVYTVPGVIPPKGYSIDLTTPQDRDRSKL